jgi:DNA-binding NarL/FixJ family response regulator
LAAAQGQANKDIAAELGCSADTVSKWCHGLQDTP